jgi:ABC-2 type transport system permease protein
MTTVAKPRGERDVRPASELRVLAAVVRRGLREQRRSPLTWGVPLGLLSALELAIYPSVHKSLSKAITSYPDALKQAFRIESINTPAQFVNGEMFSLIIPLALAFFAIRAATRPLVGAEERHWLDVVLVAPVRRRTLVAGAFVGSALSSALVLAVMGVLIWIAGEVFGAVIPLGDVAAGAASVWPLALFFAGFALVLSGVISGWATVTGIAAGLLVAMYGIDVAARVSSSLDALKPFTVFHYYDSALVNGLDVNHFFGLLGAAVVLAIAGAILFERRDIHG